MTTAITETQILEKLNSILTASGSTPQFHQTVTQNLMELLTLEGDTHAILNALRYGSVETIKSLEEKCALSEQRLQILLQYFSSMYIGNSDPLAHTAVLALEATGLTLQG